MAPSKDQILAALPRLAQPDLLVIRAAVGALLADGVAEAQTSPNNPQAWLFEAMMAVLKANYSYALFAGPSRKQFNEKAPIALAFITGAFKGVLLNKTKAMALMRYLLGLLADDLRGQRVPVTKGTLSTNLHRLEAVFDRAFPNYTGAGYADLIMTAILAK